VTSPPDWAITTPSVPVHTEPATSGGWESLSQDQLRGLRENLLRSLLGAVLQAVRGLFVPGPLQDVIDQLAGWASDLLDGNWGGDLIEAITGIFGGGLSDIGDWFGDLLGLLGNPLGLGSGNSSTLIPFGNILGLLGPVNMGGSLQALVDSLFQGFTGSGNTGTGLGVLSNTASSLADQVSWLVAEAGGIPPTIAFFSASGTYTIPTDCTTMDVLVVGGGGGGKGCGLVWGDGGEHGVWSTATIVRGTEIPQGTTTLTITVGAGGAGHTGNGSNGAASSASGTGWTGISGAGGTGATTATVSINGLSPGNQTMTGVTYYGGPQQEAFFGADGNAPGGGGAGGTVILMAGGDGAHGGVWVRSY